MAFASRRARSLDCRDHQQKETGGRVDWPRTRKLASSARCAKSISATSATTRRRSKSSMPGPRTENQSHRRRDQGSAPHHGRLTVAGRKAYPPKAPARTVHFHVGKPTVTASPNGNFPAMHWGDHLTAIGRFFRIRLHRAAQVVGSLRQFMWSKLRINSNRNRCSRSIVISVQIATV